MTRMQLTDTHCHLDLDRFEVDRQAVIDRAREAGVGRILIPGLDLASSRAAVQLAEAHDLIFAAVGVHPNSASQWSSQHPEQLRALAAHPKVVAIGEIGLDYYWDKATPDEQKTALSAQLALATELQLPVVLHNREAGADLIPWMQEWRAELQAANHELAKRPGVFHSFSGDLSNAQSILAAGFFLGFTGPVTFKNAPELREVAREVPRDRILIETDGPFLSPHPHRGKRNEPAYVRLTAEKLAEIHEMPLDPFASQTADNAMRLFRW